MIARLVVACAALVLVAAGCGGDDEPTAAAPAETAEPAPTPAGPASGANAFIGSKGIGSPLRLLWKITPPETPSWS